MPTYRSSVAADRTANWLCAYCYLRGGCITTYLTPRHLPATTTRTSLSVCAGAAVAAHARARSAASRGASLASRCPQAYLGGGGVSRAGGRSCVEHGWDMSRICAAKLHAAKRTRHTRCATAPHMPRIVPGLVILAYESSSATSTIAAVSSSPTFGLHLASL